jgi:hypothetical protein
MLKRGRGNMAKKSVKIQEIRELMAEYGAACIENVDSFSGQLL